jgi:hypothetical protein
MGSLSSAAVDECVRVGQSNETCVITHTREGFTRPSLLAGVDVRIVTMCFERRAERAPGLGDPARAAHVDEDERMTVEHAALPQQICHRRVRDQTLHIT